MSNRVEPNRTAPSEMIKLEEEQEQLKPVGDFITFGLKLTVIDKGAKIIDLCAISRYLSKS